MTNCRLLRQAAGLSQTQLAAVSLTSLGTISRLENAATTQDLDHFRVGTLRRVALALDTDITYLCQFADELDDDE